MGDTVLAIIRNYEALPILTSEEAALGDPIAIGLHHQLSSYMYLALTHLTSDILAETNHLFKIFQFRDVCFGSLRQSPFETISSFQDMHEENGMQTDMMERELAAEKVDYFKSMKITYTAIRRGQPEQRQRFTEVKEELLDNLVANIKAQFPQVNLSTRIKNLNFRPKFYGKTKVK